MKSRTPITSIIICTLLSPTASSMILISNWAHTNTTISFDISGSIDQTNTKTLNLFTINELSIFNSSLIQNDWVTSSGSTYDIANHGSGHRVIDSASYSSDSPNHIKLIFDATDYRQWQTGDSINASVTISGGTLNTEYIQPEAMILTATTPSTGNGEFNPSKIVGQIEVASVPEPSSTTLLLCGSSLAILRRRRKN